MNRIFSVILISLMTLFALSCTSFDKDTYFKEREGFKRNVRVAILPFEDAKNVKKSGINVADALMNEFIKIPNWDIVERAQIEKVIKEQAFEATGMTEKDYSKLGRLTNVDYFITGSIGQYDYYVDRENNAKIRLTINMRFIDTTQGKVIGTGRYCYQNNKNYLKGCCLFSWMFMFSADKNIERELSEVSKRIVKDIREQLNLVE